MNNGGRAKLVNGRRPTVNLLGALTTQVTLYYYGSSLPWRHRWVVGGGWSVVGGPWSVVGGRWTVEGRR